MNEWMNEWSCKRIIKEKIISENRDYRAFRPRTLCEKSYDFWNGEKKFFNV